MKRIFMLFFCWLIAFGATAQQSSMNAAQIQAELKKLNTVGRVLYVAAHPDDENTRLIAWLENQRYIPTAYFSFTRGDGGQNLIGPEIREELGIIRTQELLQARRTDGGEQFFSRANDFGYSKNPEETFTIWDKEQALSDLVWAIRNFRPDVIITRFSPDRAGKTHGHHTASAMLAKEAFDAAGDPSRFPNQLEKVSPWQPKRLFWNTSWWFYGGRENFDKSGKITVDVGEYNPLLGESMTEIAAKSRSMHKSQGFGSSGSRGTQIEYFEQLKGEKAQENLFEGIDMSWASLKGGQTVQNHIDKAMAQFSAEQPQLIIAELVKAYKAAGKLKNDFWKTQKQEDIQRLIQACAGLFIEASADERTKTAGEALTVSYEFINRSSAKVKLQSINVPLTGTDSLINKKLNNNQSLTFKQKISLPENMPVSQPYWLREAGTKGMFKVDEQELIGLPENPAAVRLQAEMKIEGEQFTFDLPLIYKRTDPVEGEVYEPFVITPPVFVELEEDVFIFSRQDSRPLMVRIKAGKANCKGELSLDLPEGWKSQPQSVAFNMELKGQEQAVTFRLTPPRQQSKGKLKAVAKMDGENYSNSLSLIDYPHIPLQTLFPQASVKVVKLDIETRGQTIGYLQGAGDLIPSSLKQIGYQVEELQPADLKPEALRRFDALVLGVRAYNTVDALKFYHDSLMDYVHNGGTLIVQYNTSFRLVRNELSPYPLQLSRDRVTVENAEVRMLKPEHPVLNFPNKITDKDFEGWVQERGLYFPNNWDDRFDAILSSNDPGESPKNGGLLVTQYGKGHYIYTGYSWFRELPAGVPGAYRLFANLLSIGHAENTN